MSTKSFGLGKQYADNTAYLKQCKKSSKRISKANKREKKDGPWRRSVRKGNCYQIIVNAHMNNDEAFEALKFHTLNNQGVGCWGTL